MCRFATTLSCILLLATQCALQQNSALAVGIEDFDLDIFENDQAVINHEDDKYINPFSSTFTNKDKAASYHQQALEFANKEQYDIALAYFRLAVRHNNESAFYWSDLGVTEMRVQQFQKAKKRFLKALSIDPNMHLARENIRELNRYASKASEQVILHDSFQESLMLEYKGGNYREHSITKTRELSRSELLKILYPKRYARLEHAWNENNNSKNKRAKQKQQSSKLKFDNDNSFDDMVNSGEIQFIPTKSFASKLAVTKEDQGEDREGPQQHGDEEEVEEQEDSKLTEEQKELFSLPFVVRGLLPPMKSYNHSQWQNRFQGKSLAKRYGQQRVDFYPHNMVEEQVHPVFNSLQDSLYQLYNKPTGVYTTLDLSEEGSYIQWNLDAYLYQDLLSDKFSGLDNLLPRFFDLQEDDNLFSSCMSLDENSNSDRQRSSSTQGELLQEDQTNPSYVDYDMLSSYYLKTHWKMLVIGNEQAGMFFHQDILQASAWQLQLQGKKKWHICPGRKERSQDSSMFISPINRNHDNYHYFYYKAGDVNMFAPDYVKFPDIRQAQCHETILSPGDLIYYPGDYWHQTSNLDTLTTALSSSMMLSPFDFHIVRKELRRECGGTNRIFARDDLFCKKLARCFQQWYQASGAGKNKGNKEGLKNSQKSEL